MCDSKSGCKHQMYGRNSLKKPFFHLMLLDHCLVASTWIFYQNSILIDDILGRLILVQSGSLELEFKMLFWIPRFLGIPDTFVVIP